MSAYENLVKLGKEKLGLKIAFKDESVLMKILGRVLFFNREFMTRYSTTIGSTVYFPSKEWVERNSEPAARVLAHELVHIADGKKWSGPLFSAAYLFPQSLALLALLAICYSNFWLLALLFLFPLPSPTRTYFELRGYAMSDACMHTMTGDTFLSEAAISKNFTTSLYYFMWPFAEDISLRILKNRKKILAGTLINDIPLTGDILACFKA